MSKISSNVPDVQATVEYEGEHGILQGAPHCTTSGSMIAYCSSRAAQSAWREYPAREHWSLRIRAIKDVVAFAMHDHLEAWTDQGYLIRVFTSAKLYSHTARISAPDHPEYAAYTDDRIPVFETGPRSAAHHSCHACTRSEIRRILDLNRYANAIGFSPSKYR